MRTGFDTGIAACANSLVPENDAFLVAQRAAGTMQYAQSACVAQVDGERVVTVDAMKIAALQEYYSPVPWSIHKALQENVVYLSPDRLFRGGNLGNDHICIRYHTFIKYLRVDSWNAAVKSPLFAFSRIAHHLAG